MMLLFTELRNRERDVWWGTLRVQFEHVKFEVCIWYFPGDLELAEPGGGIFESHQHVDGI